MGLTTTMDVDITALLITNIVWAIISQFSDAVYYLSKLFFDNYNMDQPIEWTLSIVRFTVMIVLVIVLLVLCIYVVYANVIPKETVKDNLD